MAQLLARNGERSENHSGGCIRKIPLMGIFSMEADNLPISAEVFGFCVTFMMGGGTSKLTSERCKDLQQPLSSWKHTKRKDEGICFPFIEGHAAQKKIGRKQG